MGALQGPDRGQLQAQGGASVKLYLVGGAVRDQILGRESKDQDFLAVGATESDVETRWPSAQRVGKAFPVYLVPDLGEVSLARREKKTAPGHQGFAVEFGPEVTLEEDLLRRDLTINAMARDEGGNLHDPLGGRFDLAAQLLRHVSPAFADDPLRIYRLARFSAQLGFSVAQKTIALCRAIPRDEIAGLSRERVRVEFLRAMAGEHPHRFVEVLWDIGSLDIHFSELADLAKVPAGPEKHHSEGDALTHTLMVLREAAKLSQDVNVRVAALLHDLGKAKTAPELLPRHLGHEDAGVEPIMALCERLQLSRNLRSAACLASSEHLNINRFAELRNPRKVDIIVAADRGILKAEGLADVAEADALGRIPLGTTEGPALLRRLAAVVRSAEIGTIPESLVGENIGLHIRARRAAAISRVLGSDSEATHGA